MVRQDETRIKMVVMLSVFLSVGNQMIYFL